MEDIIKTISSKAGINADQSKIALDVVLGLLKEKMPTSLGNQIEGVLSGKEFNLSAVLKEVSSEKVEEIKGAATEKLDDLKDSFKKLF